jgi:serine/alanine adding enzyme
MLTIIPYKTDTDAWNEYVYNHNNANIYHQLQWKDIIENTFGHKGYYLIATDNGIVRGLIPLFFIKSRLLGRYLISLPFLDRAGIIADNPQIATLLCEAAIDLAQHAQVDFLELRNQGGLNHVDLITATHKVNFVLSSELTADILWKKILKKNVKNKVRIAWKNKISVDIGDNAQYINEFYEVYCIHMRYLGTPVYPRNFFLNMLKEFPNNLKIILAKYKTNVIGGKIIIAFKDTLYFIAQYSLREYNEFHPNNLLYWSAIEYASENGYEFCDMGRSNINSGPFYFKKQWGAEIHPLYWQYYLHKAKQIPNLSPTNKKYALAIAIWKKLPLGLTKAAGPLIAKHIP